jgi:tetratricopeptide (TPR) repeat protein
MEFTGKQLKQLTQALLSAFPRREDLAMMVSFNLGRNLAEVAEGKTDRGVVFSLIQWAQAQGRLEELVTAARTENPENPDLSRWVAQGQIDVADSRSQVATIEGVFKIFARILWQRGEHETLIPIIDEAIDLLQDRQQGGTELLYYKASAYVHTGQYDQAALILERLLDRESNNPKYLIGRAYLHWQHGQTAQAINKVRRALGKTVSQDAEHSLVYFLAERGQEADLAEALERGEKLIRDYPEQPNVMDTWAFVLHRQGENGKALPLAERACVIEPDMGALYYTYGLILRALGQGVPADFCFQRVIELERYPTRFRHEAEKLLAQNRSVGREPRPR